MKGFLKFVVVAAVCLVGSQSYTLAVDVPPAPTNSYIEVVSYTTVTNGVGGCDYIAGIEYYSTSNNFQPKGETRVNLVGEESWTNDSTKVKYIVGSHTSTNSIHYAKYRCINDGTIRFFRFILNEW